MTSNPTACCNPHCEHRPVCHRAQMHDRGHPVSFHFDMLMHRSQGFHCYWPLQKESA